MKQMYDLPVYCVGKYTAHCAKSAGFLQVAKIEGDARSLAFSLEETSGIQQILYPCAKDRSFDFVAHLKGSGITCFNWEIYIMGLNKISRR